MAERVVQTCCCYVPPYVVTCNVTYLCYIVRGSVTYVRTYLLNSFISHDKLRYVTRWPNDGGGASSLPTCLLLTHVALSQRVTGVIARTRYINVLTYLLTYISSTIAGCANFGPDWPLLFKVHEIWSVDSQENHCCHQMPDFNAKMHQNRFRLVCDTNTTVFDTEALFKTTSRC